MSFVLLGILNSQAATGAVGDYELIQTNILGTATNAVTYSNLNTLTAYKHLQVRFAIRSVRVDADPFPLIFRANSDSGTNYSSHALYGNGTEVGSFGYATSFPYGFISSNILPNQTDAANNYGVGVTDILDFASTSKNKTFRTLAGQHTSTPFVVLESSVWRSTNAMTSLEIFTLDGQNMTVGSRFSLYGIK